jgi:hypothetical protein
MQEISGELLQSLLLAGYKGSTLGLLRLIFHNIYYTTSVEGVLNKLACLDGFCDNDKLLWLQEFPLKAESVAKPCF